MKSKLYQILDPATAYEHDEQSTFAEDVLIGLSDSPKRLPSKYFYDDAGSQIFQQICDLPEYYPTRCELEILQTNREEILQEISQSSLNLIDLGAGDGHKTATLLDWLLKNKADVTYVPIDISEGAMIDAVERTSAQYPNLKIEGLVAEYFQGIRWLSSQKKKRNLVLFLGSNIGNFDKPRTRAFLRRLWNALNEDDQVIIGFDLKKDIDLLVKAYNDSRGLTAQFNLNLLNRINRDLGGTFNIDRWRHYGAYNVCTGAMESYLVSLERQVVRIAALEQEFAFEPWEPIFTEYSNKYLEHDIDDLASCAHFAINNKYYDKKRWFCSAVWRVQKK